MLEFLLDNWMLFLGIIGVGFSSVTLYAINYKPIEIQNPSETSTFKIYILAYKYCIIYAKFTLHKNTIANYNKFVRYDKEMRDSYSKYNQGMITYIDFYNTWVICYNNIYNLV